MRTAWGEWYYPRMPNKPRTGRYIPCQICGREKYVQVNRQPTYKFCSRACLGIASRSRPHPRIGETLPCGNPSCTNTVYVPPNKKADYKKHHCSKACYDKAQTTRITRDCLHCGNPFEAIKGRKNAKFCSTPCYASHKRSMLNGASRQAARMYVKHFGLMQFCFSCGYNKVLEILEVHHIDRNPRNNKLENLMVLCPNCHLEEHFAAKDGPFGGKCRNNPAGRKSSPAEGATVYAPTVPVRATRLLPQHGKRPRARGA